MSSVTNKTSLCVICSVPIQSPFKSGTLRAPVICSKKTCKQALEKKQNPELAEMKAHKEEISVASMMESGVSSGSQDGEIITERSLDDSVTAQTMNSGMLRRLEQEATQTKALASKTTPIADSPNHSDNDAVIVESDASGEEAPFAQEQFTKKHRTLSGTDRVTQEFRRRFSSLGRQDSAKEQK